MKKPFFKSALIYALFSLNTAHSMDNNQQQNSFSQNQQRLAKILKNNPAPLKSISLIKSKNAVKKEKIEAEIPKINIANLLQLDTGYLKPLELMRAGTDREKAEKKAQAKGILNGLLVYVKTKYKPQELAKVQNAIKRIVTADPLLISTAVMVLEQAGSPSQDSYALMHQFYETRINFIDKELKKGAIYKGLIDDIDEALSYPIELRGEIQKAKDIIQLSSTNIESKQGSSVEVQSPKTGGVKHATALEIEHAKAFIVNIEKSREGLLSVIKKEDNTQKLEEANLPVKFYIETFENKINQVYCETEINPNIPENIYRPFIEDLRSILVDIKEYEEGSSNTERSMKTLRLQNIINKLNGFYTHVTAPNYCQFCLNKDMRDIKNLDKENKFSINKTFSTIQGFLEFVYAQEKNEALYPVIKETLPKLREEINNRGSKPVSDYWN